MLSNGDLLLVTTDAERSLARPEDYFNDWSFSISKILRGAIEKFYGKKAEQGYDFQYLPARIGCMAATLCCPYGIYG